MEIEIAIPSPLGQTFTYLHTEGLTPGVRVRVPFAKQGKTVGVVLGSKPDQPKGTYKYQLKPITEVIDPEPVYSPVMLELGRWLSSYYLHPIGEVLRGMLPASKSKKVKLTYELLGGPTPEEDDGNTLAPATFFGRKRTITAQTLRNKFKERGFEDKEQAKILRQWQSRGWTGLAKDVDYNVRRSKETTADKAPLAQSDGFRTLNQHQQAAVDTIVAKGLMQKVEHPFLLFGITGSGKTEVFLNVLRHMIERDTSSQALILVPEISLTPQTTRIFQARFPGLVAVVHSAMEDEERWSELDRIRRGDARILIGPRSAVFGPFQGLKLIIVDEEHDSSYKQGSSLLYNARDVAVMRGKLEGAAVVLGSATPSMESWFNAKTGKYALLELPERASKRPLPDVQTILAKPSFRSMSIVNAGDLSTLKDESPFTDEIIAALQENLINGQQSIVLVNRRGYAHYLLNLNDNKAAECPQCSISLSVHSKRRVLRCHYCDYQTTVQKAMASAPGSTWAIAGYGSQKAEESLRTLLPDARIARLDSDTVADPRALPEILGKFRAGELDILVGTQILAKGHDFPNVTLICVLEVDQLLGLPDFRGGERTFQLLVQSAGRAGRGELPGRVLVQSMRVNHPIVQEALKQDFTHFADNEMLYRKSMGYPPFGRMTLFEFNSVDGRKLDAWCKELEDKLDQLLSKHPQLITQVKILGPAPAPIEVIRGRIRRTMIVLSASHQVTRQVAMWILKEAERPPGDIRMKVDVDPQATL